MALEVNLVKCERVNLTMREKEMGLKRESFWPKGQYIQKQIGECEWM